MSQSAMMLKFVAVLSCAGALGVAIARPDVCCTNTYTLNNSIDPPNGPCAAGSILVCQFSYTVTEPGQIRAGVPAQPLCNTYTPAASEVITAPCDTAPSTGWINIGPSDVEGYCCWVTIDVWIEAGGWESTYTGYSVFPCDGEDCP